MSGLALGHQETCSGPFMEGEVRASLGSGEAESGQDMLDTSPRQAAQCQNQKGFQVVVWMVRLSPGEQGRGLPKVNYGSGRRVQWAWDPALGSFPQHLAESSVLWGMGCSHPCFADEQLK